MEIAAKPKEEVEEEDTEGVDLYKAGKKAPRDGSFFWVKLYLWTINYTL